MTYPVNNDDIKDAYVRGKVELFAKVVEIQNQHPSWVDDAVIDELYKEVERWCNMMTKRSVYTMPSGNEVTE